MTAAVDDDRDPEAAGTVALKTPSGTDRAGPDFEHAEVATEPEERQREERALSRPGQPLNLRSPFFIGLTGALGVALAYLILRVVFDAGQVLTLIGLSLFLAVGLDPAVVWLTRHRLPRWSAVLIVILVILLFVAAFVAAAVAPMGHEIHQLTVNVPKYVRDVKNGHGWLGRLAVRSPSLQPAEVGPTEQARQSLAGRWRPRGGQGHRVGLRLGIGGRRPHDLLPHRPARGTPSLAPAPAPASRRQRSAALTDEIFSRVGGFVLGNLLTSIVSGVLTTIWLFIFGVPYPILLGLMVAIVDLIPIVGSTIGGIIVSLVALTQGLPIAIATAGFYIGYRLFEDYLLTPRVMRHTVRISPGLTIVATLVGGVLLGFIGAVIAIPVAAAIHLLLEEIAFPSLDRR